MKSTFPRLAGAAALAAALMAGTAANAQEVREDVVIGRQFNLEGRHELSLVGFLSMADQYVDTNYFGAEYLYHLNQSFAFGVDFFVAFAGETKLAETLRGRPEDDTVKLKRVVSCNAPPTERNAPGTGVNQLECKPKERQRRLADYIISSVFEGNLIYGKFNILDELTVHYDLYLLGGLGAILYSTKNPKAKFIPGANPGEGEVEEMDYPDGKGAKFGLSLGGGMKLILTDHIGVRLELRDFLYPDSTENGERVGEKDSGVNQALFFGAGLSVLF